MWILCSIQKTFDKAAEHVPHTLFASWEIYDRKDLIVLISLGHTYSMVELEIPPESRYSPRSFMWGFPTR